MASKGKRRRRWLRIGAVLLLLIALLVAFAPKFAAMDFVRRKLAQALALRLDRAVDIESISASWTGGIEVRGLKIRNDNLQFAEESLIEIASARIEQPLWTLLGEGPLHIVLDRPVIRLEEQAGLTNFDEWHAALTKRIEPRPPRLPKPPPKPPRTTYIKIHDGAITLRRAMPRSDGDPRILGPGEASALFGLDRLNLDIRSDARGLRIDLDASIVAADERGHVRASLVPGTDDVTVDANIPMRLLDAILPKTGTTGHLRIEARGSKRDGPAACEKVVRVEGQLHLSNFRLPFEIEGVPVEAEANWTVSVPDHGAVIIESLQARTQQSSVNLAGQFDRSSGAFTITGAAKLDLVRTWEWLGSFSGLEDARIASGVAHLEDLSVRYVGRDDLAASFVLRVSDLRATGFTKDPIETSETTLRLDAEIKPTEITLHELVWDNSSLSGKATRAGDNIRTASLNGEIELTPLLLQLANVEEVSEPEGTITLDATLARTPDGDAEIRLGAKTRSVKFVTTGKKREPPDAELDADITVKGWRLGDWAERPERVAGNVAIRVLDKEHMAPLLAATATDIKIDDDSATAGFSVNTTDLAQIRAHVKALLGETLPAIGGDLVVTGTCAFHTPDWPERAPLFDHGEVHIRSKELVFRDEDGEKFRGPLEFESGVRRTNAGSGPLWLEGVSLTLSDSKAQNRVEIRNGYASIPLDADGDDLEDGAADVEVTLKREFLSRFVTDLDKTWVDGDLDISARIEVADPTDADESRDGRVLVDATVSTKRLLLLLGDTDRIESKMARIEVRASASRELLRQMRIGRPASIDHPARETIELHHLRAKLDTLELELNGQIHDVRGVPYLRANVSAEANGFDWRLADDELRIPGRVTAKGRITESVQPNGKVRFELTGELKVEEAHYDIVDVFDGSGVVVLEGERSPYFYRWNRDLELEAEKLVFDGQTFEKVTLQESVRSDDKPGGRHHARSGIVFTARETTIAGKKLADIRLKGTANLNAMMHVSTRPPDIAALTRVGGVYLLRKLSANLVLKGDDVRLDNLAATLNGGRVTGSASFDLSRPLEKWRADLRMKDIAISEELGQSLRYFVPILHLGPEIESNLTGKFGGVIHLHGEGLKTVDLKRSLGGTGELHLRDFVVVGSSVLKVLTLQVRYLFSGTKYNFDRADGSFEIKDGRVWIVDKLSVQGPMKLRLSGSAGLDGTLDFVIHHNRLLPLTMKGTFDDPTVRLKSILPNPFK